MPQLDARVLQEQQSREGVAGCEAIDEDRQEKESDMPAVFGEQQAFIRREERRFARDPKHRQHHHEGGEDRAIGHHRYRPRTLVKGRSVEGPDGWVKASGTARASRSRRASANAWEAAVTFAVDAVFVRRAAIASARNRPVSLSARVSALGSVESRSVVPD